MTLDINNWKEFRLGDIFSKLKIRKFNSVPENEGKINYVSSTTTNNGISSKVDYDFSKTIIKDSLTISTNGECLDCFYQNQDTYVSTDVEVIKKDNLNKYHYMFLIPIIERNKYRYSYGRKPKGEKIFDTTIKLLAKPDGSIDWDYMEKYIKQLPYSKYI